MKKIHRITLFLLIVVSITAIGCNEGEFEKIKAKSGSELNQNNNGCCEEDDDDIIINPFEVTEEELFERQR